MKRLLLQRDTVYEKSTGGKLFIDGLFFCYTLEDSMRDEKIKHETAIPYGTYKVEITYSPKFAKKMPILLNVPEYEGIRIHPGNTDKHTSGCILVGYKRNINGTISDSTRAWDRLMMILHNETDIEIEIVPGEELLHSSPQEP